jgi:hypothetical protein
MHHHLYLCTLQKVMYDLRILFRNWTVIIVAIHIVAPPSWERLRRPTGAEDRKRQHEKHGQTCTIKRSCDEVRIVLKDPWPVVSEKELHSETSDDLREDDAGL